MNVLVTGHKGYLGSVLTPMLTEAGFDVVGLDRNWFADCAFGPAPPEVPEVDKDFRDLEVHDLKELDAVLHLAGLSDEPLAALDTGLTYDINHKAAVRLAVLAKQAGVRRFVFASTCSTYSGTDSRPATEDTEFGAATPYADSKVRVEVDLREIEDERFSPVSLRAATAYGASPCLRLDSVLNRMVADAVSNGKIALSSNPDSWRPVVHVEDLARAFLAVLKAPQDTIHNRAYNVGRTSDNHRLGDLARIVAETVPESEIEMDRASATEPSCRVDFTRIEGELPEWDPQWDVRSGARHLSEALAEYGTADGPLYSRLDFVQQLIADRRLTSELRWRT